jgi:hypothetical protein
MAEVILNKKRKQRNQTKRFSFQMIFISHTAQEYVRRKCMNEQYALTIIISSALTKQNKTNESLTIELGIYLIQAIEECGSEYELEIYKLI